jgi:hypothetical protein
MMADEQLGVIELESNLADAEKPPEVTPGVYEAEIQDVQIPTSGKGNEYFATKFVIPTENLNPEIAEHYPDGAVLFYNRLIVPKGNDRRAMFNLKQFMNAIGLSTQTTSVDPNAWMGQRARIQVRMGKYLGEERAEIQAILAAERAPARAAPAPAAAARGRRGR